MASAHNGIKCNCAQAACCFNRCPICSAPFGVPRLPAAHCPLQYSPTRTESAQEADQEARPSSCVTGEPLHTFWQLLLGILHWPFFWHRMLGLGSALYLLARVGGGTRGGVVKCTPAGVQAGELWAELKLLLWTTDCHRPAELSLCLCDRSSCCHSALCEKSLPEKNCHPPCAKLLSYLPQVAGSKAKSPWSSVLASAGKVAIQGLWERNTHRFGC